MSVALRKLNTQDSVAKMLSIISRKYSIFILDHQTHPNYVLLAGMQLSVDLTFSAW